MIAEEDNLTDTSKPKRFRLVVRSAEEAVRMIREKLGDNARVVSVRQTGGEGLKRFISSPKLEVIAEIPPVENSSNAEPNVPSDDSEKIVNEVPSVDKSNIEGHDLENVAKPLHPSKSPELSNDLPQDALQLLSRAGFDDVLVSQIKSWPEVGDISNLPLADVLRKVTQCLSDRFKSTPQVPLGSKTALLGSPGSGKTTMLCKMLAHEVFIKKKLPMVLKLENGVPNPDDSLRIFCEVIGVTLYREESKIPNATLQSPLFIDIPGISLSDAAEWSKIKASLTSLGVSSRILVVNGAYDSKVLSKCVRIGGNLDATHLAITHFDELSNASKLWPIIFDSALSPYCISTGQNITGDFSSNVLNQMIAKSFPENLYTQSFSSYQRI
jgi:flagellar biosynthesis protein FlhF